MSCKQEYTIEVKESNEIILTFKNPDTVRPLEIF